MFVFALFPLSRKTQYSILTLLSSVVFGHTFHSILCAASFPTLQVSRLRCSLCLDTLFIPKFLTFNVLLSIQSKLLYKSFHHSQRTISIFMMSFIDFVRFWVIAILQKIEIGKWLSCVHFLF